MANAPIDARLLMGTQKAATVIPHYWLYLGARAGYSSRYFTLSSELKDDRKYIESRGRGDSFEAAIQVAGQVLPFLSVQAEAIFAKDKAPFRGYREEDTSEGDENEKKLKLFEDTFESMSLTLPIMVKGTFWFDRFLVAPMAGLYLTLPLGKMNGPVMVPKLDDAGNAVTNDDGEELFEPKDADTPFKYSVPLGFTAGATLGMRLGPGNLFLDARYSIDFGKTVLKLEQETTVYRRSSLSVSLGYEFGLLKKK
jgi:hypothetical protein